jgi:sodium transport system ATP-binding protein
MIQVSGLSKTFSDSKRGTRLAVDDVSFEARAGEVFGLLGPNGAGKTTTLRMLATLLKPTSGTATLNGFDVTREPQRVREQIGFLSGDMGLYGRLTPLEILDFFGKLNSMDASRRASRIDGLMTMLDMQSFAGIRTDKLSTGMKQKTAIARTMLHDPPVLILDEPTSGLDVPTVRMLSSLPGFEASTAFCLIPIFNVSLVIRGILQGDVSMVNFGITMAANLVYAGIAFVIATRQFESESVLFRS